AVVAHCPASGVKVYVPVAVLLTVDGLQVPVTPLVDVVGKTGAVSLVHKAGMTSNVGSVLGLTVTVNEAGDAHCPGSGVNVYVPVAVLLTLAGLHVPVKPLVDVVGKTGAVSFSQISGIASKVGRIF